MSPQVQEKTNRDKTALLLVVMFNSMIVYMCAAIELYFGRIGIPTVAASFISGMWMCAYWVDNSIFDFSSHTLSLKKL